MQTHYFPASERGLKDIGWLKSNFYFSFSDSYHPMKSAFGTLVAFNDDYVEKGKGFGIHPHLNMEIISILLKGKITTRIHLVIALLLKKVAYKLRVPAQVCGMKNITLGKKM